MPEAPNEQVFGLSREQESSFGRQYISNERSSSLRDDMRAEALSEALKEGKHYIASPEAGSIADQTYWVLRRVNQKDKTLGTPILLDNGSAEPLRLAFVDRVDAQLFEKILNQAAS